MELDHLRTASDLQELLKIRDRIDDLAARRLPGDGVAPRAELHDQGDAYRLVLEVPGVAQENLEIALQGTELVIIGHAEAEKDAGEVVFSERLQGPFRRSLTLPGPVDATNATAQLASGLLIVRLPKVDERCQDD